MALITNLADCGNNNKVTDEALSIRYQVVSGETVTSNEFSLIVWHVRRFATKRYRFVGMDRATACALRDDKIEQYTRTRIIDSYSNGHAVSQTFAQNCQADIKAVHDSGCMWRVEIQVNETDEILKEVFSTDPPPETPAALFAELGIDDNPATYDE